jgi:hypothetical protein
VVEYYWQKGLLGTAGKIDVSNFWNPTVDRKMWVGQGTESLITSGWFVENLVPIMQYIMGKNLAGVQKTSPAIHSSPNFQCSNSTKHFSKSFLLRFDSPANWDVSDSPSSNARGNNPSTHQPRVC